MKIPQLLAEYMDSWLSMASIRKFETANRETDGVNLMPGLVCSDKQLPLPNSLAC